MATPYKHIVVVHGIGDQVVNETGVNFMNGLGRALPVQPEFRLEVKNLVSRITERIEPGKSDPAYVIVTRPAHEDKPELEYCVGFSEVFWQPVTNDYLHAHGKRPPVPIFTWAHSINLRFRGKNRQSLLGWAEAITNLEKLLGLVGKLATISKKSKIFHRVIVRFLGDVEMYGETGQIRGLVNDVFNEALADIEETKKKIVMPRGETLDETEIYIVAHSEGTVVSWKCLQLAAEKPTIGPDARPLWLDQVKGLVTMGSPIDKHHLFWKDSFPADIATEQKVKIPWWNFWDYSDPVAYSLDCIFPVDSAHENNQFERRFDAGFARYPIPGYAHVQYWNDNAILRKIIAEVMGIEADFPVVETEVVSRWWGKWWLMRSADFLAYSLFRVAELSAIVFFLAHLLAPLFSLLNSAWVENSLPSLGTIDAPMLAAAWAWLITPWKALLVLLGWKIFWDITLEMSAKRYRLMKKHQVYIDSQQRVERYVENGGMMLVLVLVALNLKVSNPCGVTCVETKDYVGWALGLVFSILCWQLHTTVHKGLLQLWRYAKGQDSKFQPLKPEAPLSRPPARPSAGDQGGVPA